MSSFLVNLVRRSAGLPATIIRTPPPSPFEAGLGNHVDAATETQGAIHDLAGAEQPTTGNAATQAAWRASSSEERVALPLEAPTQPTPAVQRLAGTAPSIPTQPPGAEPSATIRTTALGPLPEPRWSVLPHARAAQVTAIEPPKRLEPAMPPYPGERDNGMTSEVAHDLPTTSSVVHDIEAVSPPARQMRSLPSTSAMIQESSHMPGVALPELAPERLWSAAQPRNETALSAATLRPALTESHTLLDFPSLPSHASLTPSAQLPIHVRIGRVEVRPTTASEPTPARPSSPAPVGFDAYYRIRQYRS